MECEVCGCPNKPVLTTAEIARGLRCSQQTVRNELKRGKLQGYKVGSEWRVKHASVDRYVAARQGGIGNHLVPW